MQTRAFQLDRLFVEVFEESAQDALIFLIREAVLGDDLRGDRGFVHGAPHIRAGGARLGPGRSASHQRKGPALRPALDHQFWIAA